MCYILPAPTRLFHFLPLFYTHFAYVVEIYIVLRLEMRNAGHNPMKLGLFSEVPEHQRGFCPFMALLPLS